MLKFDFFFCIFCIYLSNLSNGVSGFSLPQVYFSSTGISLKNGRTLKFLFTRIWLGIGPYHLDISQNIVICCYTPCIVKFYWLSHIFRLIMAITLTYMKHIVRLLVFLFLFMLFNFYFSKHTNDPSFPSSVLSRHSSFM